MGVRPEFVKSIDELLARAAGAVSLARDEAVSHGDDVRSYDHIAEGIADLRNKIAAKL